MLAIRNSKLIGSQHARIMPSFGLFLRAQWVRLALTSTMASFADLSCVIATVSHTQIMSDRNADQCEQNGSCEKQ